MVLKGEMFVYCESSDCKNPKILLDKKETLLHKKKIKNDENIEYYCKYHSYLREYRAQRCSLIKCENPALDCKPFCREHERKFRFKCCLNIEGKLFCNKHYKKYLIYEKEYKTSDEGLETLIQVDNPLDYGYKINN